MALISVRISHLELNLEQMVNIATNDVKSHNFSLKVHKFVIGNDLPGDVNFTVATTSDSLVTRGIAKKELELVNLQLLVPVGLKMTC